VWVSDTLEAAFDKVRRGMFAGRRDGFDEEIVKVVELYGSSPSGYVVEEGWTRASSCDAIRGSLGFV
jgi:hypothetical protein